MELIKNNETFKITDVRENGWKLTGSATKNSLGSINISLDVHPAENLSGDNVGSFYYSETGESVSTNCQTTKSVKTEFETYANSIVNDVLNQLKTQA